MFVYRLAISLLFWHVLPERLHAVTGRPGSSLLHAGVLRLLMPYTLTGRSYCPCDFSHYPAEKKQSVHEHFIDLKLLH